MGNNLSVKVTADIVDLEAKLSVAQTRARNFGTELRDLAKQAAAADEVQREKLNPALLQAAENFAHAKAEASAYQAEIRKVQPPGGGHGIEGVEALHAGLEKLAAPMQALTGVGEALGAAFGIEQAVEKVSELVGKFGELGEQMTRAMETTGMTAEQLSGLRVTAAENGLEFDSLNRVMTKFASNIDEAGKGSLKQQAAFAALGINADELTKHGDDLNYMLELVAKRLDQYEAGGRKADIITAIFGSKIQGLAPILKDIAENGMAGLQRHAAELGGLFGKDLVEKADQTHKSFSDAKLAADNLQASFGNLLSGTAGPMLDFFTRMDGAAAQVNNTLAAGPGFWSKYWGITPEVWLTRLAKTMIAGPPAPSAAPGAQPSAAAPGAEPASGSAAEARSGVGGKPQAPAMFDASGAIADMHTKLEQIAATWNDTQSTMLVRQRTVVDQEIAEFNRQFGAGAAKSKDYQSLVQEDARLAVQIKRTTGQELIAETRTENATVNGDYRLSSVERLTQEQKNWQTLLSDERLTAEQRKQVEREVAQATAALNRESFAENRSIKVSDANTEVALARLSFEQKKQTYEQDFEAHRISASQKEAVLETLTRDEYRLAQSAVDAEMVGLHQGTAAYEEATNKKRALEAQLQRDLANLRHQGATDERKEAQEQAKAWEGAVREIESAESSMLGDLLSRRKTFAQSAISVAGQLVDREIQADVKAATTRLLIQNKEEAQKRASSEGGLLYHLFTENRKVAETARSEAAQTGAAVTGNEMRVASKEVAAGQEKTISSAVGSKTILADAAKAFSGTYSSVAQIPYVGWILAPIAASAAYAAVMAYEGLASLDVGAWDVPGDMPANIHRGEMVVPATFASGLRASGFGGPTGASNTYGDTHIHNNFGGVMATTDQVMAAFSKAVRNGHPAIKAARG